MSNQVIVQKGRTNTVVVNLGMNISADTFTSEIRTEPTSESPLIAAWTVSFVTNGSDGQLLLKMDDSVTSQIQPNSGYMDLKRMSGGEPIAVFDKPLEVLFRDTVTL